MKKLTRKQIVLVVLMAVCTVLFAFWLVRLVDSISKIISINPQPFSHYQFRQILTTLVCFLFIYVFFVWFIILSIKEHSINKMLFIVSLILCSLFFVLCVWLLIDNLIKTTECIAEQLQYLVEYPNLLNELNTTIYTNIIFQANIALFYGLFLWLAIATVKREKPINDHRRHEEDN